MSDIELPSADFRARVLAAAAARAATPPGAWRRRVLWASFSGLVWLGLVATVRGVHADLASIPLASLALTFGTLGGAALLATALGLARGAGMIGPSIETLRLALCGLALLLLALVLGVDFGAPGSAVLVPSTLGHALGCELLILFVALPMLALGLWTLRGVLRSSPSLSGACLGLAAATWAHLVVRAICPVVGVAHAVGGHWLPLLPLLAVGAIAAQLWDRRSLRGYSFQVRES